MMMVVMTHLGRMMGVDTGRPRRPMMVDVVLMEVVVVVAKLVRQRGIEGWVLQRVRGCSRG